MSTYLQVLVFALIVPLIFSFHNKNNFYKQWSSFFKANFLVAIPFLVWDELFTRNNVWGFNDEHLTGVYFLNLPIEEILFFIIIPYCCVFTYETLLKFKLNIKNTHLVTLSTGIIILLIGIIFYNKIYTTITFVALGALLIILAFQKKEFTETFFLMYLLITVSFFILINGTLTGGIHNNPPVWYNNSETLNIRIWTIPIEDFFYSMLLLLSNVWMYEKFKSKKVKKNN